MCIRDSTYTILGSAIAYQFGLTRYNQGLESKSFRFIAIDEAFKAQDEDKARYLITLCKQLHLQLPVSYTHLDVYKRQKFRITLAKLV